MIEIIFKTIICHLLGDYILQSDFIAKTKGANWYHLFVHSMLYIFPFYLFFGFNIDLALLFLSHFVIDAGKARFNKISYAHDQLLHYMMAIICLA